MEDLEKALNIVCERTGHNRFRELCDPLSPAYNPAYISVVLKMAGMGAEVASQSRRLVVARYQENLDWLDLVPDVIGDVVVYNKGDYLEGSIPMPNKGRESSAYLKHICDFYHKLADTTFFVQGNPFDHSPDLFKRLTLPYELPTSLTRRYRGTYPSWKIKSHDLVENHHGIEVRYGDALLQGTKKQPWFNPLAWDFVFSVPMPAQMYFGYGCQWAVPKSAITARPREFWRSLLRNLDSGETGKSWTEPPLNPWSFESIAKYLFSSPIEFPHKESWLTIKQPRFVSRPRSCCGGDKRPRLGDQ